MPGSREDFSRNNAFLLYDLNGHAPAQEILSFYINQKKSINIEFTGKSKEEMFEKHKCSPGAKFRRAGFKLELSFKLAVSQFNKSNASENLICLV